MTVSLAESFKMMLSDFQIYSINIHIFEIPFYVDVSDATGSCSLIVWTKYDSILNVILNQEALITICFFASMRFHSRLCWWRVKY